jgi:Uma2 family endonuclease
MSTVREITVPDTTPATEWVNGRALQKMSPQHPHARAQGRWSAALLAWADDTGSGRVGSEWEFRVTPPGDVTRPLVPDVAFLSYDRLGYDQDEAADIPRMAPDVAIEIISPGDRWADLDEKARVYLAAGAKLVLIADPSSQTLIARDSIRERTYEANDIFEHGSLPGFVLRVGSIFEKSKPKP